jgi:hypothetical protein
MTPLTTSEWKTQGGLTARAVKVKEYSIGKARVNVTGPLAASEENMPLTVHVPVTSLLFQPALTPQKNRRRKSCGTIFGES